MISGLGGSINWTNGSSNTNIQCDNWQAAFEINLVPMWGADSQPWPDLCSDKITPGVITFSGTQNTEFNPFATGFATPPMTLGAGSLLVLNVNSSGNSRHITMHATRVKKWIVGNVANGVASLQGEIWGNFATNGEFGPWTITDGGTEYNLWAEANY